MNKAVTEGLGLMPPPFSAGLDVWSQTTGRPGTATYAGAPNAVFVPSDPDFDGCLELLKTADTQRLRWMGEVPMQPGLYLRVTVRIKALSGNLPSVRIAGWAGHAGGSNVGAVPQTGPSVMLQTYGQVVEVSAIIGSGARGGVDMPWGVVPVFGHFGLDLTGLNGGVVRIDDIRIEDVSRFWLSEKLGVVDVRDYGALGDGSTDDLAAFEAAADAAEGRTVLVPEGSYRIGGHLSIPGPVRFEGTLVMEDDHRLLLQSGYDFPTYAAAFGSDDAGFRKGVQALFHFNDHVTFDLRGRRVRLQSPVDVAALAGLDEFTARRTIANGQIDVIASGDWDSVTLTRTASYDPSNPLRLSGMSNINSLPVGARVTGVGVGREVYVRSRSPAAGNATLSQPFYGGAGTQNLTFTRDAYALDFSGFDNLRRFEIEHVEFLCRGAASAVMLPRDGGILRFNDCTFNRPKDRGITSIGGGCQGLLIDHCQFLAPDMALPVQERTSIAFNVNSNDSKIRNNRAVMWGHFAILNGAGHLIMGNHYFQGDTQPSGVRRGGIVLTQPNVKTTITGNYIDNNFLEWTNEHSANPAHDNGFSFGGLTVTGNTFTCNDVAPWFSWIVIKPYGPGHFLQGLNVNGNVFRTVNGRIDRVDTVDSTYATLDYNRTRNVIFDNNAFNGVDIPAQSPLVIRHEQNSPATTWTVDTAGRLPFSGWARTVSALVMEGAPTGGGGAVRSQMPYVTVQQGANNDQVRLHWPEGTQGRAMVTIRVDNPL
ncbi:right-handed parallel beta-helix repeat-containing protein [Rhodobacteraceae bacterium 2376]|uniref:Right-handed parallel beta-helix repeat-containing protein n=1 Tax=Rhabdonatronobacter sediminivivens TaxID=2743469 RepID=A0A7Z0L1K5_9RHOB|nr:glycosyl hydrolase family 28-related protein [Rhabdonatronobacter sediminivivens]NYS25943.1 right-handed parallel beta-helix repeat-containing protein [Rhabdonatronobacter sediminivivens]